MVETLAEAGVDYGSFDILSDDDVSDPYPPAFLRNRTVLHSSPRGPC